jgi:hypothetical protein
MIRLYQANLNDLAEYFDELRSSSISWQTPSADVVSRANEYYSISAPLPSEDTTSFEDLVRWFVGNYSGNVSHCTSRASTFCYLQLFVPSFPHWTVVGKERERERERLLLLLLLFFFCFFFARLECFCLN